MNTNATPPEQVSEDGAEQQACATGQCGGADGCGPSGPTWTKTAVFAVVMLAAVGVGAYSLTKTPGAATPTVAVPSCVEAAAAQATADTEGGQGAYVPECMRRAGMAAVSERAAGNAEAAADAASPSRATAATAAPSCGERKSPCCGE